jgi:hypothetical protein
MEKTMTQTNSEKRQSNNKRLLWYRIGLFIIGLLGAGYTTASVIYVADRHSIYVTDSNGQSVREVITGLNEVWGLAVVDNRIFWVEYINSSSTIAIIRSARIDGSNLVDVITQGSPLGIATNPNSKKLYWRDSDLKMIRSSDLDGGNIVNIVSTNDPSFGIALDITGGKIYWTDIWLDTNGSNWPVIRQSNLDGSGASNFTNPGAGNYGPNLAVDHKGGRLFSTGSPSNTCEHSLSTGEARCTSGSWWGDLSWIAIDEQQRYSFITIQQTIYKLDLELPFTSPYAGSTYPNWRWSTIRGIAVAPTDGGSQVPPNLLNTPEQPIYGAPPPAVTVPPEKRKHLVLLIHGWNSDPGAWAVDMKESIARQLDDSYSGDPCDKDHLVKVGNIYWQICTYSWKELANTGFLDPWKAYVNALDVGKVLAKYIVDEQHGYDFIHFIAHSAGSHVADTAATWLPILIDRYNKDNPATPLTIPDIYTTFLDAFDPRGDSSPYGKFSNWAEQYVDSRRTGPAGLDDFTNITLPNAYNFDVTALDPNPPGPAGIDAHAWPYKWYQSTIDDNIVGYGFGLSLESGNTSFPPKNGKRCFFTSNTVCSEDDKAAKQVELRVVVDDVLALPLDAAITSITGTVLFEQIIGENILKLITGSPAWVSLPIEVTEPIDTLNFNYVYQRQAEGLLSVFFDNQLVYRSDQRVEPSGTNQSGNVPIGAIASGTHTLSFRLDAFNGTQSEIDISRIQLGKMEVSTSPVDATPPVITPTVTGILGNNGWYTSDITVSWEVTDAESDITFTDGCQTTAVTTDTSSVTFTCSATSGGGPVSQSVTIKRDATPPTITGSASPAANANDWRNSAVTVSFTCDDALSGIATCTAPQTLGEGTNQSASGTATDKAGNTASTEVTGISVDMTPPVIAGMPTTCTLWPPNHKMVQVATVTATDALSGVAPGSFSVTGTSNEPFDPSDPDIVIQPNGSGSFMVQLRADRLGTGTGRIYTLTATATDRGGNTATSTSTCKVPHDQGKSN